MERFDHQFRVWKEKEIFLRAKNLFLRPVAALMFNKTIFINNFCVKLFFSWEKK